MVLVKAPTWVMMVTWCGVVKEVRPAMVNMQRVVASRVTLLVPSKRKVEFFMQC